MSVDCSSLKKFESACNKVLKKISKELIAAEKEFQNAVQRKRAALEKLHSRKLHMRDVCRAESSFDDAEDAKQVSLEKLEDLISELNAMETECLYRAAPMGSMMKTLARRKHSGIKRS